MNIGIIGYNFSRRLAYIGICVALIAVCSWITIPMVIPFTLQTFAIFFTLMTLGGKDGTIAIFIYILSGTIGLPVFSGFKGGLGVISGATGGYIFGFIFSALIFWLFEKMSRGNKVVAVISIISGLIVCYFCGTLWYMKIFSDSGNRIGFFAVLTTCVFPFIIPDFVKITLSFIISNKIKKIMNKNNSQ